MSGFEYTNGTCKRKETTNCVELVCYGRDLCWGPSDQDMRGIPWRVDDLTTRSAAQNQQVDHAVPKTWPWHARTRRAAWCCLTGDMRGNSSVFAVTSPLLCCSSWNTQCTHTYNAFKARAHPVTLENVLWRLRSQYPCCWFSLPLQYPLASNKAPKVGWWAAVRGTFPQRRHMTNFSHDNKNKLEMLFQWWFLLGHHDHQANPHVHQHHAVWTTTFSRSVWVAPAFIKSSNLT